MLRVGLVVDVRGWALGSIATSIASASTQERMRFEIFDDSDLTPRHLGRCARLASCDVVHWLSTATWRRLGSAPVGRKSIVSVHHVAPWETWKCSLPPAHVTIAHSEGAADEIEAVCGQRPMRVLPYGFDPADFSLCSEQERQAARSTHGISPDAVVIGTSGKGTNQRKNVPLLLKSLSSLDRSRPVELVITGKGWDQHLPALAELVDGVHYVEASDAAELRSCYAAMDLYACTSSVEGGPLPLLEAAACGTPFVSTDVGHAKEILSTCREAGTVACAEQYDTALQAELSRHRTPDRSREVAGAAAAREWTEVVGKYEALYGEVSQRHSSDPVRSLLALERTVSLNYVRVRLARTQNRGSQRK